MTMRRTFLFTGAVVACFGWLAAGAAIAASVNYRAPEETAAFKPGPNLEVVQSNCGACHSADYVKTQPPMKNKQQFWQAEVTKMIKVYGAQINDADVGKIVEYLASTY
jgi:mono/diheme cytochrome c family protein